LGAIVPPALGCRGINNGSGGGSNGSITVSLEGPSHAGIVRIRGIVGASVTVSTVGPGLALVYNSAIRSSYEHRHLVALFVGSGNIVGLGTSISDLGKRTKVGGAGRSNRSITVAYKSPSQVVIVAWLVLRAVASLVDIA
jgi:hypothetical protein